MKLVVDVNVVIAAVMGEPERDWAVEVTRGNEAIGPRSFPFEIGNALTRLVKRKRLPPENIENAWLAASRFKILLKDIDVAAAVRLAASHNMYAYDGYILQCTLESGATLVTLDRPLIAVAHKIGLKVMEK